MLICMNIPEKGGEIAFVEVDGEKPTDASLLDNSGFLKGAL